MNSGELFLCGCRVRPLDAEALLIRLGRLRDNVEVDVVHKLSAKKAQMNIHAQVTQHSLKSAVSHPHIENFIRT